MEYRVVRTGDPDPHFEHALFGGGRQKGAQNKNHKYLARAWWQNKWRYAYTQAEVAALQNLGKARQAAKDVGNKAKAGAAKVTKAVSDVASGKYARDVDSRADRYAESAAQRSAASKRQSSFADINRRTYQTFSKVADKSREDAKKPLRKITGLSNIDKAAANLADESAKVSANEASRLTTMSRQNSAGARSDAKKAAEAEAEKNTAAYKISKAAGNASRAVREAADRVSDTARDVGNRVSNAARSAADSVRNSSAGRYASNAAEARRAERERDEATASGNRQAAIDAENRRENAETQRRNAASDARNSVTSVAEKGRAAAERILNSVSNAARGAANKVSDAVGAERAERERDKAAASGDRQGAIDAENRRSSKSNEINSAIDRASDSARAAAEKGKAAVERLFNRASSTARDVGSKVSDTAERIVDRASNTANSAADKGRAAAEKLLNRVSSAVKSAGEKATDAASKAYGNVKTQIDLAENAINESRFDRYGENRIKNAQKKIDSIDKELADYEKEAAKDSRFKEQNQGWLSIKQRERAEAVKELSEAKKWQKDWEDSDKTLYRSTDEVSDMNPNMRKSEPVTSSQRKEEIKEQNLYKYNSDYRKASDRASEIGSYLDNWDARGGPQTAEGKASYNKMMRELKQLESELEKMRK